MTSINNLKTVMLLAALTALLVFIGRILGGSGGMVFALFFAFIMNFGAYWFSDKIALRMAGAKDVSEIEAPDLHRLVSQVSQYARMPKPKVCIIDNPSPNAFATGRDPKHAAVAVTTGILRILTRDELAGVLSHEMAHVKNRDTLVVTLVATIAGAITMIAQMAQWAMIFGGFGGRDDDDGGGIGSLVVGLLMIILAPIAAMVIQLAISRAREYGADATGAKILGNPMALANALEKLEQGSKTVPMNVNPAVSPLFIVNPLGGGLMRGLFSTHPPIAERVERLHQMAMNPTAYGVGA
ncbi:MAG: zinc metalloprotease HtpX [Dehalococcoidia bacterium]|nr:zinc metalloprotease HtpX [Dehalococcoidia bacterium]